ncbi:hypothetical protein VNI00_019081 [Paramarasmius palmivorus]|uniref:Uncharacterized protein n=1 Tax=Paramarasmius palmivorus TaxID=297713 RepID=A0AAW0AQC3_9AGAR
MSKTRSSGQFDFLQELMKTDSDLHAEHQGMLKRFQEVFPALLALPTTAESGKDDPKDEPQQSQNVPTGKDDVSRVTRDQAILKRIKRWALHHFAQSVADTDERVDGVEGTIPEKR